MKQFVKQALAVGALALASGAAFADASTAGVSDVGSNSSVTPIGQNASGGLVLSIFSTNPEQNLSLSGYLGLTQDQIIPTEMDEAGLTLTWDISDLLALTDLSGYDSLVWGVNAYDGNNPDTLATTVDTVNSSTTTILNGLVDDSGALQDAINGSNNANSNPGPVDIDTTALSSSDVMSSGPNVGYGIDGYYWTTDTSSTLAMYQYVTNSGSQFAASTVTVYEGTWSIDVEAGTLTYSVAAVPLPAAGWLLLSALGGLGVVGRRRRA